MHLEPRDPETIVQVVYKTAAKTFDGPIGGYMTLDGTEDSGNNAAAQVAAQPQTQAAPQVQAASSSPVEEATQAPAPVQQTQAAAPATTPTSEIQTPTPVDSPAPVETSQAQIPTTQTAAVAPVAKTQKSEGKAIPTSVESSSETSKPTQAAKKQTLASNSIASQASSQTTSPTPTQNTSGSSSSITGNAASQSTSTSSAVASHQSDGMSGGAKAGLAIGILLAIGLLLGLIFFCYRRKKKHQREAYQVADDEKSMARDVDHGAAVGRSASTRTTTTAPRLSLRPVTQFLPDLAGKRRSGNALAAAGARSLAPADAVNEKKPAQSESAHPANPFGDHAEPYEKAISSRTEKSMVPNQANDPTNPFGNHAEAPGQPTSKDRSLATDAPLPAPLRIRTPTPEGNSYAAGAVLAAAGVAGHRANAPAPLNVTPNRAASPGPMPSPCGTEFSMSSATPASMANGPPSSNVHRVQLDFKPSMDDELALRAGQLVRLLHEYDDGWVSQMVYSLPDSANVFSGAVHPSRSFATRCSATYMSFRSTCETSP